MPEVLRISAADGWELVVWTKDDETPRRRLTKTLDERGAGLAPAVIRLLPDISIAAPEGGFLPPSAEYHLPYPVFFENRQYEFDFTFSRLPAGEPPGISHWRTDIEDLFHLSKDGRNLRGSINFGNDIGWFRLCLECGGRKQYISFEILPTKMDLAGDYEQISSVIDKVYPLWRFAFARRTDLELSTSRKPHENFPLLWLALFRNLREELEKAVRLICRSPHSRLLPRERFLRPDRLKGKLSPHLEERITEQCANGEHHRRHAIETKRLSVDTPENRFVKMVLTRSSRNLAGFLTKARANDGAPEQGRLSRAFFEELENWRRPLEQRLAEPLFREVGDYAGMTGESLVLHHRAGYAKVYRIWQELKLYLDLFGRSASVSLKSISELYEVWCLLEVRRMLEELGFEEDSARKALLRTRGFEKELKDGMGTAFNLVRPGDSLKIRLAHEPCFDRKGNSGIFSFTTPQKPDILLEATFTDGRRIRWIFDAKYRIAPDDDKEYDRIPDDAVNQMHRYRDALIHQSKSDDECDEKSRPVVGAYVLYPGWFGDEENDNPYGRWIKEVGIGGFPLLPGRQNCWLKEFLLSKFGTPVVKPPDADEHLLHESVRIPPTGLKLERYSDLALAASLGGAAGRTKEYVDRFLEGTAGWYHLPVSTQENRKIPRAVMREVRFCAVSVHQPGSHDRMIEYLYDVKSVRLVKRCDLTVEQAGSIAPANGSEYWLFELGPARQLPSPLRIAGVRSFRFRLTSASGILAGKSWQELEERYPGVTGKAATRELGVVPI